LAAFLDAISARKSHQTTSHYVACNVARCGSASDAARASLQTAKALQASIMSHGAISISVSFSLGSFIEDTGDAIVLRTLDQVVARAQALSRKLVAGNTHASVEDVLADRAI
jgi:hypothetical protein